MHIINTGDFIFGCLFGSIALYLFLGFFFKAAWLHTDGRRQGGRWVVVSCSQWERAGVLLVWALLAFTNFDSAFHKHASSMRFIIETVVLAVVGLLYLIDRSRKNKARNRLDTLAHKHGLF